MFFFEKVSGERSGPFKTKFGANQLTIFNDKLIVDEGDFAIQKLPNGREEQFKVTDVKYSSGMRRIKPHYVLQITKASKIEQEKKVAASNTFHIHNSNVQVGDGNVQNIVNSFEQLAAEIDSTDATPVEKEKAKGELKSLLTNPTVAAILGGAVSGLLGIL